MERFRGPILQVPPMVSARKVEGRRLYELAREGKVVERARAVGGRSHLIALRRVRIGSLDVSDAVSIDDAVDAAESGEMERVLIRPGLALSELPEIRVDEAMADAVRNGRTLPEILVPDGIDPDASIRIGDRRGDLLAVYRRDRTALRPEVVLS
jgi:tRNA pseudouridine55 synthase